MQYTNHISVYNYDDYQEILKDLIEIRKNQGMPFSYRWFSQRAGFSSPNYLHLILNKKRHLSESATEKVIQVFKLGHGEAEYFRLLVLFNKAKSPTERAQIGEKILNLRSRAKTRYLRTDQMDYYLSWKNIAIRECLLLNKTALTPAEIVSLVYPRPTLKEVHESLRLLKSMNLAEQTEADCWSAVPGIISSGDRVASSTLIKYHKEMIDLANGSLDRFTGKERDISNTTVPISLENFEKIRSLIKALRTEILKISEEDQNPSMVAQINFQLFPLAIKKECNK